MAALAGRNLLAHEQNPKTRMPGNKNAERGGFLAFLNSATRAIAGLPVEKLP